MIVLFIRIVFLDDLVVDSTANSATLPALYCSRDLALLFPRPHGCNIIGQWYDAVRRLSYSSCSSSEISVRGTEYIFVQNVTVVEIRIGLDLLARGGCGLSASQIEQTRCIGGCPMGFQGLQPSHFHLPSFSSS